MKTLILATQLLCAGLPCMAADKERKEMIQEPAKPAAETHLNNILSNDTAALAKSYADDVTLMPGHEFLKPKYGLANLPDRSKAAKVKSTALIAVIKKMAKDRPKRSQEKITQKLKSVTYKRLKANNGDFATEASDEVKTPDGKLHFTVIEGDQIFKVSPPKGDFLLLQMRSIKGKWRVVAECID